ncbi:hypothetical protein LMG27174_04137 [Paraburkholderia rhynchosiae]|uniref:Uncharacterized protein n=1 Tax=Paraburkholderia rhynchosiae TaxID=487049 RepID=A0A6J5BKP0_9BURK|nr:hypothetical protein LMG27174_04137 [Paraburkholderia rhynchosiae]
MHALFLHWGCAQWAHERGTLDIHSLASIKDSQ